MTSNSSFRVVIPARFSSTRLPGKPLVDLKGKTMIRRVVEQTMLSKSIETIVATDDSRVVEAVKGTGAAVVMTREDHQSGSDRIMEVVQHAGWSDDDIVVNVQGDEPLIPPSVINQVAALLTNSSDVAVATLFERIHEKEDVFDPNIVKTVVSKAGRALYFSRAPVPWKRGEFDGELDVPLETGWKRHIGIYAYRCWALRKFVGLLPSALESTEFLEQLRFLENDIDIRIDEAVVAVPGGVDTYADVLRVLNVLEN